MSRDHEHPAADQQANDAGPAADHHDVTDTAVNPEHHLTATADIPEDDPQEVVPDDDEDTDADKRANGSDNGRS